ncbi:MAG: hypothetical protein M0P64_00500 [Candidatus Pacebacteria bacterium]|nr:hypothetical protein [Candidatus Paceibacterota bacterium]
MESSSLNQIEIFARIAMQGFETQMRIIDCLENGATKQAYIEELYCKLVTFSEAIEKNKEVLLANIEEEANASAKQLDAIRSFLDELARASDEQYAKVCANEMRKSEKNTLHNIGTDESKFSSTIIQHSNALKKEVEGLIKQVNNLRT